MANCLISFKKDLKKPKFKKKLQRLEKILTFVFFLGLIFLLIIFFATVKVIGKQVKADCQLAQSKYSGDCVEALISFLADETNSPRKRNSAIWALGQLGDKRAVPILKFYYRGYKRGERENLHIELSQYELKKALNLAQGGLNITAPFWR